ncbi:YTH domain-containing protein, partial [Drosera capensis]
MAAVAAAGNVDNLLQKLSLDSKTKTLDAHGSTKKFGSHGSTNLSNGLGKQLGRPFTPDFSMYYPSHGYPSSPYYYQGQYAGYFSRANPNDQLLGHNTNTYRANSGFGLNYMNAKSNWGWPAAQKGYTNGLSSYGSRNGDRLNELSKGPRSTNFKTTADLASVKLGIKGQDVSSNVPDRAQYNKDDFPETYLDAKFFVIKSYSEDDVHKSIKYSAWASTPNGNKKLDAAYKDAQGKPGGCPVFLLFSVNASGQFVGLSEMVGHVDFDRTMDFWQQDKWTGYIPLKWHIVKDIPNSLLKHIKLEYNDNKPVTNSRDTQEVKLEQGIEVLKVFKLHSSKISILDDFDFYEARERSMQERKAKKQILLKQVKDDIHSEDQKSSKVADEPNGVEVSKVEASAVTNGPHFGEPFLGLAEMVGHHDTDQSLDFRYNNKGMGCIPIKWYIIKDVPVDLLNHIKLENNNDQPITNSEDVQEAKLEQGFEVIEIFKLYPNKSYILEDFENFGLRELFEQADKEEKKRKLREL